MANAKNRKGKIVKADRSGVREVGDTKVVYLNLPVDVATKLAAEAEAEDRPMSVQAARIIKQHFEGKR